ncbi:MAG: FkbM family methyltransferase [Actinomycetota bacterium]
MASRTIRRLIWSLYVQHQRTYTFSTRQGVFTVYGKDNVIAYLLYCTGQYERELMMETFSFLRSQGQLSPAGRGTLVDIGANIGVICVAGAHLDQVQRIVAIEPDPANFALLQQNVRQNGLADRAVCLPQAVAEQKGELEFELSADNFGDHRVHSVDQIAPDGDLFDESRRQIISVRSDRLDEIIGRLPQEFSEEIALVWIDIQGYEGFAFRSGPNFFGRGMPVVSEIWPYAIRRAGMSDAEFCSTVGQLWSGYARLIDGEFAYFPIDSFSEYYASLDRAQFENVIFLAEDGRS